MTTPLDLVLFVAVPYMTLLLAIGAAIYRYRTDRFSYSSLSSQFLENRKLFWGSVPFHWGLLAVLAAHLLGVFFPSWVAAFNGVTLRLYFMEVTGLAFALLALVGLINLIVRRLGDSKLQAVTSPMDIVVLLLLLVSLLSGIGIALFYRWGSDWYWQMAAPYIWSLVLLRPEPQYMASLPVLVQVHVLNFFLLLLVFPFSRLVHVVTVPIAYLWRPVQLVRWNRRRPASAQR